jgi:hypothetical protein
MKERFCLKVVAISLLLVNLIQTTAAGAASGCQSWADEGAVPAASKETSNETHHRSTEPRFVFEVSKINERVVKEFQKAWRISKSGTNGQEGVVLIYKHVEGGYMARVLGRTNEYKRFTFKWDPAAVAVVHTHPNEADPVPQADDIYLADKYRVPVLTITRLGMYIYDPHTRKISKLMAGLDWLQEQGSEERMKAEGGRMKKE